MILKASSRGNGFDLAVHLMNGYDNEQVELAEVRGTIADDLYGAFAEFEAIASGTRAKKPLYSLSMNPAEKLTRAQYAEAIDAIEGKLGLTGQPRIVVFHIKDGREHAHIVWSRIDADAMKAVHMSYDHSKLMDMAVVLAEKFGHNLPDGLKAWKKGETFAKEKLETNLQENANAKKTGISAEERRAEITAAYVAADSAAATQNALEEKGYVLARGDKRAIVFVDRFGDAYSLSRYVKGVTRKEYRGRMEALPLARLPSVEEARAEQRARQKASEERAREQHRPRQRMESHGPDDPGRQEFEAFKRSIAEKQAAMEKARAARGLALTQAEQKLLLTQQQERMALHAAQKAEARGLLFKVRARVAELVAGSPALQSVLGRITERVGLDPRDRHKLENEALDRRHAREKQGIDGKRKGLEKIAQREEASLKRDLKREALVRAEAIAAQLKEKTKEEKRKQAQTTDPRLLEEGALGEEFNVEAGAQQARSSTDGEGAGEGTAGPRKSWKDRAQVMGARRSRGKGYGMRRDGGD